jgi:hypothetical protein
MRFMAKAADAERRKGEERVRADAVAAARWTAPVAAAATSAALAPAPTAAAVIAAAVGAAAAAAAPAARKRPRVVCEADDDSFVMPPPGDGGAGAVDEGVARLLTHGVALGGRRSFRSYNGPLEATVRAEVAGREARPDMDEEAMAEVLSRRGGAMAPASAGGGGGKRGRGGGLGRR